MTRFKAHPMRREEFVSFVARIIQELRGSKALASAMRALLSGQVREDELEARVATEGPIALASLYYAIGRLEQEGLLYKTIESEHGEPIATIEPLLSGQTIALEVIAPELLVTLSPYAIFRRDQEEIVIEAPVGAARVRLHDLEYFSLIGRLTVPVVAAEIAASIDGRSGGAARALVAALLSAGVIERTAADSDASHAAEQGWEAHDLLFHARSRSGWSAARCGATYRFSGENERSPALKCPPPGAVVDLPRPGERLTHPGFFDVLEWRQSIRYSDRPVTLEALGALLYHAARVRSLANAPDGAEIAARPYPSAGASYELEVYAVVGPRPEIEPAIYYYDPLNHQLRHMTSAEATLAPLEDARVAAGAPQAPDVLLIVTARFRRVAWKYESIAYALILKDVGILLGTLSLVATALGLATCLIGDGDGRRFCSSTGLDFLEESPVGELMIVGLTEGPLS